MTWPTCGDLRTHLLTLTVLASIGVARSQPLIELADQATDELTYSRILPIAGAGWVFFGYQNDPGGVASKNTLTARDPIGNLLWTVGFTGMQLVSGEVVAGPDSTILACGSRNGCDVLFEESVITRIGSDGTAQWTFEVSTPWLNHIATNATDLIAFASDNEVRIVDLFGDSLTGWTSPATPIGTLCWTSDSDLLIAANNKLYLTDTAGSFHDSLSITGEVVQLAVRADNSIWVLCEDELLIVSHDLEPVASWSLSEYETAKRLAIDANNAWVLTLDELVFVDGTSGPLSAFAIADLPGHTVADMACRDGQIVTAGTSELFTTRAAVMRSYDTNGNTVPHDEDISIAITSIDSVWLDPVFPAGSEYSMSADFTVTLQNNGSTVVDELLLAHSSGDTWICGMTGTMIPLTQLQLLPGQSMVVQMETVHAGPRTYPPGGNASAEFCIVAASPNHVVDRDTTDNQACATAAIVGVAVPEMEAVDRFHVFPNPFTDHLFIDAVNGTDAAMDIQVLDPMGRTIHGARSLPEATGRHRIDVPRLAPGTYIVHIRSGDTFIKRRVVHMQ